MDHFLDRVWGIIDGFLKSTVVFLDTILSPLELFGPGVVIFILAFLIAGITRVFSRFYVTKRYVKLEKEFHHWQGVREEAMKHPDREKGKTLAKNIDQAELNRAYYDYFFEGLLKNFITTVLPILLMVSYVAKVYTPQSLLERFGEEWVFSFGTASPLNVSSFLWFVICLILSFILFAVFKVMFKKRNGKKNAA